MPSPTAALATLRPDIAGSFMEFDAAADRLNFIGSQVLPVQEVFKASGNFGLIPIEEIIKTGDTARAPGAGYGRGKHEFTPQTFLTQEHGWEEPVDDAQADMYATYFDAEAIAAQRAMHIVLLNAEKRVAAAVFNTSTWTGAALTTGITHEWDDATNAVPITDVDTAKKAIWDGCGLWPNALIINRKVFMNLRNVAQIVDRMKSQTFQDVKPSKITALTLAQVFDLDYVLVGGGAKDTKVKGQATVVGPIWSDEYAMICKIATTQDISEPCIGRMFHWGEDGSTIGGTIETYRDETVRGSIVRVRHQVQEKIIYPQAGHLLSNVTT